MFILYAIKNPLGISPKTGGFLQHKQEKQQKKHFKPMCDNMLSR